MYKPNTDGWRKLSNRRFDQAPFLKESVEKYDLWIVSVSSAFVQPNFTETGWGLTRAPADLIANLRETIRSAYDAGDYREEGNVDVIDGLTPLFIDRPELTEKVLHELHPMHEAWAGIPLQPHVAYGFRLYRNESSLLMHIDKSDTHIISCILHIDSSDDAEPWPIVIEDFTGATNEVILSPGDMLFYESSKCVHGRPSKFIGTWYSSVFVHYYPSDPEWQTTDHHLEAHYAVPGNWDLPPSWESRLPAIEMKGASFREPACPNDWCNLADATRFYGPAKKDYVITSGPSMYPLWGLSDEL
jgi:hypothetical protein